jgi:hypothetical protein
VCKVSFRNVNLYKLHTYKQTLIVIYIYIYITYTGCTEKDATQRSDLYMYTLKQAQNSPPLQWLLPTLPESSSKSSLPTFSSVGYRLHSNSVTNNMGLPQERALCVGLLVLYGRCIVPLEWISINQSEQ